MYRAPENSNRVKAMRLKFESQEVTATTGGKQNNNNLSNGCTEPTKPKIKVKARSMEDENSTDRNNIQTRVLGRQLSDPVKRNIKRTPAFRLDKNSFIEKDHIFQRNASVRNQLARLNDNCDNKVSCNNITNEMNDVEIGNTPKTASQTSLSKRVTLSHLYSEAIPKSKRISHMTTTKNDEFDEIHNAMTLELNKSPTKQSKNDRNSIQTAKNVIEILENLDSLINGSDTIKTALKRPLPPGPAPKKPPRTFQHSPQHSQKDISKSNCDLSSIIQEDDFTKKLNDNLQKQITRTKSPKKDPKYMLEKLENALKTNKIKLRQQKFDFGSDDDDEKRMLKSATNSPLLKRLNNFNIRSASSQRLNFNCLNSFGCSGGTSANSDDANHSFSRDVIDSEEPIYAEPFQYDDIIRKGSLSNSPVKEKSGKPQRNSLYYMSSPVLSLDVNSTTQNSSFLDELQDTNERQVNNSSGSQSTFSSDTDSNVSTPVDFTTTNSSSAFVKDLIKSFEDKDKVTATSGVQLRKSTEVKCSNGDANGHRYAVVCPVDGKTSGNVTRAASKFEIYVRTVRTFSAKKMSNKNLFHCCLLVGLDGKRPYIKSKFPADIDVPAYIEALCFPDSEDVHINYSAKEQCYLLVITDASGDRIYGYCRRVLPEGSSTCLPLAYCILTKHRAPRFYKRILEELESHHGLPDKKRNDLFNEFYKHDFPKPGHSIRLDLSNITRHEVKYYDSNFERKVSDAENNNDDRKLAGSAIDEQKCPHGIVNLARSRSNGKAGDECPICSGVGRHELVLTLHQDMRYEETDLKELCETLHVGLLQKVFENLLLERKVIFTSSHLSKLSSCIEAIQSVLYPFSWPHAFIPILPKTRWEIVEAPAPLICGVLSNKVIDEHKVENGIVVDLDSKTVLLEVEDDEKILPDCAIKSWKKGLIAANSIPTSVNEDNVLLSDAFIRVFIQTCGHYKEFISNNMFDKEGFKAFPKSKGIRRFLQWFTQTTMFDLFIDAVLTNPDSFYIFNSRIKIYSSQDATLILEKMKDWKKV